MSLSIRNPCLPNELVREIVENLAPWQRKTLLSLTLVNKAWRLESQRVLFRSVYDECGSSMVHDHLMITHELFLGCIVSSPRLASYVQVYVQCYLAADPDDRDEYRLGEENDLWKLTARALPAMVHLKHLYFTSRGAGQRSFQHLLRGCTFQLETLYWGCDNGHKEGDAQDDLHDHFIPFLCTQTSLLHLGVTDWRKEPENRGLPWMTDETCPNLVSTSCKFDSIGQIATKQKIIALRLGNDDPLRSFVDRIPHMYLSALTRLRYLSVPDYPQLRNFTGGSIDLNITLLELEFWNMTDTIERLSHLPNLQVLALGYCTEPDGCVEPVQDVAIVSLPKCPNLQQVILRRGAPHHSPYSMPEIKEERFEMERIPGAAWWKPYYA